MSYRKLIDDAAAMLANRKSVVLEESSSLNDMSFDQLKEKLYNARLQQHNLREGSFDQVNNDHEIAKTLAQIEFRQLDEATQQARSVAASVKRSADLRAKLEQKKAELRKRGFSEEQINRQLGLEEDLVGNQHKLDHNQDGKIDASDLHNTRKKGAAKKLNTDRWSANEKDVNRVSGISGAVKRLTKESVIASIFERQLDEAHKLGDRVMITHTSAKGVVGHVGEIRHGSYKGAPKTYTIDYQHPKHHIGTKSSIQLSSKEFKSHKEGTLGEAATNKALALKKWNC